MKKNKKRIKLDYSTLTDEELLSIVAYEVLRLSKFSVEEIINFKNDIPKLPISQQVKDYLYQLCNDVMLSNIKK